MVKKDRVCIHMFHNELYIIEKYMLRAMTKPALMTFSNIKAINFDFNA